MTDNTASDSSVVSLGSKDWQDLSKYDYAKVIFSDLHHDKDSVRCQFLITDDVHEDPDDIVGLFRIGYKNLTHCLASKKLSDLLRNGNLWHCSFEGNDMPALEDGCYQFVYITHDTKEVCGASMPLEVESKGKDDSSEEDVVADKTEDDFLLVRSNVFDKINDLQGKLHEYELKIAMLENQIAQLTENMALQLKQKDGHYQLQINALQGQLKEFEHQTAKLEEKRVHTMAEMAKLLQERDDSHKSEMEKAKDALKAKLEDLSKMLLSSKNETTCFKKLYEDASLSEKKSVFAAQKLSHQVEELEKALRNKDAALAENLKILVQDKKMGEYQSENLRAMCVALEESKKLALNEMSDQTKRINEANEKLNDLKCQNFGLKLQLDDEQVVSSEQKQVIDQLKKEVNMCTKLCDDKEKLVNKHVLQIEKLKHELTKLEQKCIQKDGVIVKHVADIDKLKSDVKKLKEYCNNQDGLVNKTSKESSKVEAEKSVLKAKLDKELESGQTNATKVLKLEAEKTVLKTKLNRERTQLETQTRISEELKSQLSNLLQKNDVTQEVFNMEPVEIEARFKELNAQIADLQAENTDMKEKAVNKDEVVQFQAILTELKAKRAELEQKIVYKDQEIKMISEEVPTRTDMENELTDKVNDLKSTCALWAEEVTDLTAHCAELQKKIKDMELISVSLKEELMKKEGVIEYLNGLKGQLLTIQSDQLEAVEDRDARLKEAELLYKKQFLEIQSLKKKCRKLQERKKVDEISLAETLASITGGMTDSLEKSTEISLKEVKSASPATDCSDWVENIAQAVASRHSNDCDTGERVARASISKLDKNEAVSLQMSAAPTTDKERISSDPERTPDFKSPKMKMAERLNEIPKVSPHGSNSTEIFQMMEKNLAGLRISAANAKHESGTAVGVGMLPPVTLPCALCKKVISVAAASNADAMMDHLSESHNQKMCPVCGRLFDKSLPLKYFLFHLNEHNVPL